MKVEHARIQLLVRLFIAIDLSNDVKESLVRLMVGSKGAKWVARENLHLTLGFLGEVRENEVQDIDYALKRVRYNPFSLELGGLDVFSSGRRVRSLWVGIIEKSDVVNLKKRVESALFQIGIESDRRKYIPHVTLARLRGKLSKIPNLYSSFDLQNRIPVQVDSFSLFSSYLGRGGAIYSRVFHYPLSKY